VVLLSALTLGLGLAACAVESAPPNDPSRGAVSQSSAPSGDCRAQQDGCVARCKTAAPDEASRQPCYNSCMRQSGGCAP
jgi:hypothetical protein